MLDFATYSPDDRALTKARARQAAQVTMPSVSGGAFSTENVANFADDQTKVIALLGSISSEQGGKAESWQVLPLAGPDGSCPPLLVDAIRDFQTFWHGQGVVQVVDGVVDPGKSTLAKLNELVPEIPAIPTTVDVIVKFQGALGVPMPLSPGSIFPDALLAPYLGKEGRSLVRIGQTTTTIRDESAQLIAEHVDRIKLAFQGAEAGVVCIYGSSSGGRNAVDLAVSLTREGIAVRYVAALDAAWFPDEALNAPDNPTVIPMFRPSGQILAARKESYFQTFGNHSELTLHGLAFTSAMAGKEVHGNIEGFAPRDFTTEVQAAQPVDDDDAHIKLTQIATPVVQGIIASILADL